MNAPDFAATIERFTGFGGHYDAVRPAPPAVLAELLLPMAGCATPDLVVDLGSGTGLASRYWSQYLARMQASGQFRFVRECLVHHVEEGGADRLVGLLLSQGHVQTLLKQGLTHEDLHIDRLRAVAERAFGTSTTRWHWSARVRIGIR